MELVATISKHMKSTRFDEKAIKSIKLRDDVLYLNYITKNGEVEEVMFPDIEDAHHFLSNTLSEYEYGQFSGELLQNFLRSLEGLLKARLKNAQSGYGKVPQLGFCRFLVAHAIENLIRISSFQNKAVSSGITKVEVSLAQKMVCYYYRNQSSLKEDCFIIIDGAADYKELKSFICSCIPMFNFGNLTFGEADSLCKELFKKQMRKAAREITQ